jgi:hypothetical protein
MTGRFLRGEAATEGKYQFFDLTQRAGAGSSRELPQGTGEARQGQLYLWYLQFEYAWFRNLGTRKPLCYIEKLEHSQRKHP